MISKSIDWINKITMSLSLEVLLFLFFFSIYSLTVYGRLRYGDETERFLQAQSLVERQSWAIEQVPAHWALGADGKTYYSQFELGYGLLLVPFYAMGKLVFSFASDLAQAEGTFLLVSFVNPILTALTCVLLFRFSRFIGVRLMTAIVVTLIYGLGTLAWPYTRGLYREATQAFALLLAVFAVVVFQDVRRLVWLVVAGMAFGFLVFTKVSNLALLPVFLLYLGYILRTRESCSLFSTKSLFRFLHFLIPIVMFLVIQGKVNEFKFGNFFDIGPYNYREPLPFFSLATLPAGVWGLIFSPEKGLLFYAPPVVLFFFCLRHWFRIQPERAVFVLLLILVNVLYNGAYRYWEGGTYWGPRYLVLMVPLMLLPIGICLDIERRHKSILWICTSFLFVTGFGIQLLGGFVGDRDYLDITGQWIQITGALEFLQYGALDSLFIYIQPKAGIEINPHGVIVIGLIIIFGVWIGLLARHQNHSGQSLGWNIAVLLITWIVILVSLYTHIISVYPRVLTGQGNTRFAAAERFFENKRYCEAQNLYLMSLFFGTDWMHLAREKFELISPRAAGVQIDLGELAASIESSEGLEVEHDVYNSLTNEGGLRISASTQAPVSGAILTDFIPLKPQKRYELGGWFRAKAIKDGYAVVVWYEDDGRWRSSKSYDLTHFKGSHGWQPFRTTITTLPTTRRGLIKVGLWHATGTLWVEGVYLIEIDEQLPMRSLCNR